MLFDLRKKKKLTQIEIAKLIKVSVKQFQRYERKEVIPPLDKAIEWGKALDIKIAKFVELYYK
jgi:transcriptional regulator with XRE-family HTH domain